MFYDSELLEPVNYDLFKSIANYVFNKCDMVKFFVPNTQSFNVDSLRGTTLDCFHRGYIKTCEGESWGVRGTIFVFKITEDIQNYFLQKGSISGRLYLEVNGKKCLENPTFCDGDVEYVSSCSHEGDILIERGFKRDLEKHFVFTIKNSENYQKMLENTKRLSYSQKKDWEEVSYVFFNLYNYIQEDRKAPVFVAPEIICPFSQFKELVEEFLTEDEVALFEGCNRYSDIDYKAIGNKFHEFVYYQNLIIKFNVK